MSDASRADSADAIFGYRDADAPLTVYVDLSSLFFFAVRRICTRERVESDLVPRQKTHRSVAGGSCCSTPLTSGLRSLRAAVVHVLCSSRLLVFRLTKRRQKIRFNRPPYSQPELSSPWTTTSLLRLEKPVRAAVFFFRPRTARYYRDGFSVVLSRRFVTAR